MTRIAIISSSKCKPNKCHQECKKSCPVVKSGKQCIEVTGKSKLAFISEPLCIGKLQLPSYLPVFFVVTTYHIFCSEHVAHFTVQVVVYASRSAHSMPLPLSTSPRISSEIRLIATVPILSSCIAFLCLVQVRSWASLEQTVSENRRLLKFWPGK